MHILSERILRGRVVGKKNAACLLLRAKGCLWSHTGPPLPSLPEPGWELLSMLNPSDPSMDPFSNRISLLWTPESQSTPRLEGALPLRLEHPEGLQPSLAFGEDFLQQQMVNKVCRMSNSFISV